MSEERPPISGRAAEDLAELKAGQTRMDDRLGRLEQDVAGLKGGFDQMDKRMGNVEGLQRWSIGLLVTILLALVALVFRGFPAS